MPNNHALLLSLYENPLAAGAIPTGVQAKTASHDRIVGYLLGDARSDESALEPETVDSLPHVPPRAGVAFCPVDSLPHVPPRAGVAFSPVDSLPHVPPRAGIAFCPVESLPHVPPR